MPTPCTYCLHTGVLRDEQVLVRGEELYLCAPRGQLVEGYLVIAPYRCIGCLAELPDESLDELLRLKARVAEFYAREAFVYEQGRAGGGASAAEIGFPLHAHLCFLPIDAGVEVLFAKHERIDVAGLRQLRNAAASRPYVYVENGASRVYVPRDEAGAAELRQLRLKPQLAALLGIPERGHWRDYPGDRELARVIAAFQKGRGS